MNRLPTLALLLFTLFALVPAAVHAQGLPLQPIDDIVAVVEDDVILRSELQQAVSSIQAQYAGRSNQLPPFDVLQKQVLERLILLRLQVQRAESAGIRVSDDDVEQAVRRIAQQNNLSLDQLRQQLAKEGLDYSEFRATLREELTAQRLRQNVIQSRVQVTESEVDIALASNSLKRGQVRVASLLVAVPDNATQEQINVAKRKIDGIRELLTRGEMEFSAAAIRYSDAPNALEGGDSGWRGYDEVPSLFANLLQGMKVGDISPPVRGPNGFLLLKLVDTREEGRETVTEYNARSILLRPSELLSATEARRKLEELRTRIANGEDFAKLAKEHSQDTLTRDAGGDMGWFQAYAWGSAIGDVLVRLKDGELSPVFQSEAGLHLIQRVASREHDVTSESQRNRARETIGRRKSEEEFERFLRQLRDEAFVETRLKT